MNLNISHMTKLNVTFYILSIITIVTIFFTYPFLKYPFDMFRHLLMIDDYYTNPYKIIDVHPPYWHHFWAKVFHILQIDNSQIFLRAKIIHITQMLIAYFGIFYFSHTFIRLLFKDIQTIYVNYLAYWSTFIWFTLFATYSEGYHLIWNQWYSLSYQITLPLTLVVMGLTLSIIYDKLSFSSKILRMISLIILSFIILKIHSMEYIYYLMYIALLSLLYIDRLFYFFKSHLLFLFIMTLFLFLIFTNLHTIAQFAYYREPPFLQYFTPEKLPELWNKIIHDGHYVVAHLSRSDASFNELYYVSIFLVSLMLFVTLTHYFMQKNKLIRFRLLGFLFITSFFVFIPINTYTAGISAVITHVNLVNRFYYSSLLFLVLPVSILYILLLVSRKKIFILNFIIPAVLLSVFIYSRYDIEHSQNYYKNIQSLKHSFNEQKVGFQLSHNQILKIGSILKQYQLSSDQKKLYIYAREDIAFVIRYVYQQDVYLPKHWNGREMDIHKYIQAYKKSDKENKVLFLIPDDFPQYTPYK